MKLLLVMSAWALALRAQTTPVQPPAKPVETFQSAMEKQRAAMQIQRESMRKQRELAQEWRPPPVLGETECQPIAEPDLTPLIARASQTHQLDSKLLRGVMQQESGFRPCAISPKGARGLMQLMPATLEQFKVEDAFDPTANIEAGAAFLKQLLDKYKGDMKLALAAYNAGPAAVDKAGAIPDIKETRDYVESILRKVQ